MQYILIFWNSAHILVKAKDLEKSDRMGRENSTLKILIQIFFFLLQSKTLILFSTL